jgi:hypothetical protein
VIGTLSAQVYTSNIVVPPALNNIDAKRNNWIAPPADNDNVSLSLHACRDCEGTVTLVKIPFTYDHRSDLCSEHRQGSDPPIAVQWTTENPAPNRCRTNVDPSLTVPILK